MEEIKRLHRKEAWDLLPERYSSLIKSLIAIRGSNPDMPNEYKRTIQSAIQTFNGIENDIDKAIIRKTEMPDAANLNKIVSRQIDKIQPMLIEIRNKIGR
jgi:ribosomal protein S13